MLVGMSREEELAETAAADTPAATSGGEPLGDTLGRYKIERVLGAGGMGVVHAAFDPELQRRVAVKVLKRAVDVDDSDRARLADGRPYIVMELVEGESLADWLRTSRPHREILAAFAAAGRGLVAAHAGGLVHRDLKPQNEVPPQKRLE